MTSRSEHERDRSQHASSGHSAGCFRATRQRSTTRRQDTAAMLEETLASMRQQLVNKRQELRRDRQHWKTLVVWKKKVLEFFRRLPSFIPKELEEFEEEFKRKVTRETPRWVDGRVETEKPFTTEGRTVTTCAQSNRAKARNNTLRRSEEGRSPGVSLGTKRQTV